MHSAGPRAVIIALIKLGICVSDLKKKHFEANAVFPG